MSDFQNRVDGLMRDGMLFGAAVLQARLEVREEQMRVHRDERWVRHSDATKAGIRRAKSEAIAARITAEKQRHWKVA